MPKPDNHKWEKYKSTLIEAETTICGEKKITNNRKRTSWWWNEEVKKIVILKKLA